METSSKDGIDLVQEVKNDVRKASTEEDKRKSEEFSTFIIRQA